MQGSFHAQKRRGARERATSARVVARGAFRSRALAICTHVDARTSAVDTSFLPQLSPLQGAPAGLRREGVPLLLQDPCHQYEFDRRGDIRETLDSIDRDADHRGDGRARALGRGPPGGITDLSLRDRVGTLLLGLVLVTCIETRKLVRRLGRTRPAR